MRDAVQVYAYVYYFDPNSMKRILEEIEKDGLNNNEPRQYTEKSRLYLFQYLERESIRRSHGRGIVSYWNTTYSDSIGLNFYLSLLPIHRKESIDSCGFYLKEIAKKLYSKTHTENSKERRRWQNIYKTFIKYCISAKIPEEDLEAVIRTDESIDDKKVKEYFEIIEDNIPIMINNGLVSADSPRHRFKIKLWLLTKTNDIDFILDSVEKMTRFSQPWEKEFCRYTESKYELEELGKHIIYCLRDIYKDNPTKGIQEIEYYISLYLKYIGRTKWYMGPISEAQQSIVSLCGEESAAKILAACVQDNREQSTPYEQCQESSSGNILTKKFPK